MENQSAGITSPESEPPLPEALPDWIVECLSRLFSAISDPTRIRIVHALTVNDRLNVTELADHINLSVSAISHQLRLLRDRSLLTASRDGRSVYYSLADEHLRSLFRTGVQHAQEDCNNNLRREADRRS
ncbi:MAG: ArsR/SmtB family transcription factor [Thermoanaerobaculales bacterium]